LHVIAERRGRALLREQLDGAKNRLKVAERTRLAVELHDSLSQSLTGVSFEIKTALNLVADDAEAAVRHLGLASKTLLFCRNELRNCIWELRSQALEARRMDDAIRQTLRPHLGQAELNVRFNVPRRRLSDDTAHALLRIIRELASNAVRHGHATRIQIAGCLEADKIVFSVADNGCGFDPVLSPGVNEGHFGLQGVRERVASQGGSINIESRRSAGTRIVVSLKVQTPKEETEGR
ncbi:MAG: sensor histidine kinase, partial [Kiritimatiellae bacterium]|nr:sensor histidine kinase [Kiritimatiellia bacterium]